MKNCSEFKDINLRNFRLPDNVYFAVETIGLEDRRAANDVVILALEEYIEKYKKEKGLTEIPVTAKRLSKVGG